MSQGDNYLGGHHDINLFKTSRHVRQYGIFGDRMNRGHHDIDAYPSYLL